MTSRRNALTGRRFTDPSGRPVVPEQYLGEGGEGWVYTIRNSPDVMKVWKPGRTPEDAEEKIGHMVRNRVTPPPGVQWTATWPKYIIREKGKIAGFAMPKLDNQTQWKAVFNYYNRSQAENTGNDQERTIQISNRVRIASNLALGYGAVHKAGYVVGDINQKNAEVNRHDDVAFMDCDSYGFTATVNGVSRKFPTKVGMPEFQAPEAQHDYESREQEQDLFALAVLIFQLLTGFHPHTVRDQPEYPLPQDRIKAWLFPPSVPSVNTTDEYRAAWHALTKQQQTLFDRCFNKRHANRPRPKPKEWLEALRTYPAEPAPTRQSQPARAPQPRNPAAPPQPNANQPRPRPPQPQQTRPVPPLPPNQLRTRRVGNEIRVDWASSARATSYEAEYRRSNEILWTKAATSPNGTQATIRIPWQHQDNYEVRVRAKNTYGHSAWVHEQLNKSSTSQPGSPEPKPPAISIVVVFLTMVGIAIIMFAATLRSSDEPATPRPNIAHPHPGSTAPTAEPLLLPIIWPTFTPSPDQDGTTADDVGNGSLEYQAAAQFASCGDQYQGDEYRQRLATALDALRSGLHNVPSLYAATDKCIFGRTQ